MLRSILVPLDVSEYTSAAIEMAAHMALQKRHGESRRVIVTGLSIVDKDQFPTGRYATVVNREELERDAHAKADDLVSLFLERTRKLGLSEDQVRCSKVMGSPFNEIVHASVFSDLILMGEQCSFPPVNQDYQTMHHLYHRASRPVLLNQKHVKEVKRVVVAMDGTASSSRMLYTFLHLNPFPQAEVVLTYSKQEEQQYQLEDFYERLKAHVEEFFRKVRVVTMDGGMEESIASLVDQEGGDLLAIGIHESHFLTRLRDVMNLRDPFADKLLRGMKASLFTVH